MHVGQRHVGDGLVEQLQHRGADRARGDHRPMGRIVVDSFSRHVGGLVVVRDVGREDADEWWAASNAVGVRGAGKMVWEQANRIIRRLLRQSRPV